MNVWKMTPSRISRRPSKQKKKAQESGGYLEEEISQAPGRETQAAQPLTSFTRTARRPWRPAHASRSRSLGILLLASAGMRPAASLGSGRPADAVRALIAQGPLIRPRLPLSAFNQSFVTGSAAMRSKQPTQNDLLTEALWRNGRWTPVTKAVAERVVAMKEARLGPNDRRLVPSIKNLGEVLLRSGDSKRAVGQFERRLALQRRVGVVDPQAIADALDDLARAMSQAGRHDEAVETVRQSVQLRESALAADGISVARTLEIQSEVFLHRGEYPQARPPLERALAIRERAQPMHPDMAASLALNVDVLWFEGKPSEARDAGRRALTLAERTLRTDHPDIAVLCRKLASPLVALGEFEMAFELRKRAMAIAENAFGLDDLNLAGYLNDLANSHELKSEYSAARALYERALTIYDRGQGSLNGAATFEHNLAIVSAVLGDFPLAMKHQLRAVALWKQAFGPQHPFVAAGISSVAKLLLDQGQNADAARLYQQVLAIRERSLGPDHPDVARTLADLATARSFGVRVDSAEAPRCRLSDLGNRETSNNRELPAF